MTRAAAPLLVFDLDGTLAETAPDLTVALNTVLEGQGLPPVAADLARTMVGRGGRVMIRKGLERAGVSVSEERLEELFRDFLGHYEAHVADHSVLYEGVLDALDRFAAAGWRFAVCTNKYEHSAILLLRSLDVADRFAAICGQNTFAVCKPDGGALLQTIARAGGASDAAIMVGDSKTDIDAARHAGIPVIAVDFGYTDQPVETYAPDRVISHFDALWDAVRDLSREWP